MVVRMFSFFHMCAGCFLESVGVPDSVVRSQRERQEKMSKWPLKTGGLSCSEDVNRHREFCWSDSDEFSLLQVCLVFAPFFFPQSSQDTGLSSTTVCTEFLIACTPKGLTSAFRLSSVP